MAKITITIDTDDMSDIDVGTYSDLIIDPIIHVDSFRADNNTLHTVDASTNTIPVIPLLNPEPNQTFTLVVLEASPTYPVIIDFVSESSLVYGKVTNYIISHSNANVKFRYVSATVGYVVDQG